MVLDVWCAQKVCLLCSGVLPSKRHKINVRMAGTICESYTKHYCASCIRDIAEGKKKCLGHEEYQCGRYGYCTRCKQIGASYEGLLKKKEREEKKRIQKRTVLSLLEICVKFVANIPHALLNLSQVLQDENVWTLVEKHIKPTLRKGVKEELLEHQRENGRAMYRALGKLFGCYYARGGAKEVDCGPQKKQKTNL